MPRPRPEEGGHGEVCQGDGDARVLPAPWGACIEGEAVLKAATGGSAASIQGEK